MVFEWLFSAGFLVFIVIFFPHSQVNVLNFCKVKGIMKMKMKEEISRNTIQ